MAQNNPFGDLLPSQSAPSGGGIIRPNNPFAENDEARKNEAAAREAERVELARQAAALSAQSEGRQAGAQQFQQGNAAFDNASKFRSDFNASAPVKEYQAVVPLLMAGLQTAPNAQGDNALIYAYAKIMDPGSVVRESEGEAAANTAGWVEAAVTRAKKNFGWGTVPGRGLPANAADGLRVEMNRKVAQMAKVYGVERARYQQMAKRHGFDPNDIVGPSPAEPFVAKYLELVPGARDKANAVPDFSKAGTGGEPAQTLDPTAPFSTDADKKNSAIFNAAFKSGASLEELQALSQTISGAPLTKTQIDYITANPNRATAREFRPTKSGKPGMLQDIVTSAAQTAPGAALGAYANAALGGLPQLASGDATFDAMREGSPKASFAGDVLGGFTGTVLPAAGAMKLGVAAPRAATAANLAYGSLFGANTSEGDRLNGAAAGLGASLVGDTVGKYALAPIATKIMDAAPVQAAANKARGMFGRGPVAVPRPIDVGEAAVGDEAAPRIQDILSQLDEAAKLNLPFSLADADPALRQQLGSAARLSPDVRSTVGGQLQDRALGQADRALSGVNRSLVSPVSMSAESDAIRKAAQDAATPHYERAYQQPALTTPELEGLLKRPSLKDAMGRANRIISEEGGNAQTLGFGLDATGAPILNPIPANELAGLGKAHTDLAAARDALKRANASLSPGNVSGLQRNVDEATARLEAAKATMSAAPSVDALSTMPAYNWKALDYSKRGLDDVVETYRDPLTRRLNLDEGGRAVDRTRTQYRTTLGSLNDDYRQGLDAYSGVIKGRDALNNGYSVADTGTNMDQFGQAFGAIQPEDAMRFKQGYSTALSDRINKARLSANPYDIVAGTPDQQAKLAALYPGAPNFLRQREMEKQMAETAREVTGGSPTQERALADQRFTGSGPNMGDVAEIGASFATGLPPVGVATRAVAGGAKGMFGRRAQQRAAERAQVAAPMLYNPDPTASAASIKALIDDIMSRRKYQDAIKAGSSLIAGGGAAGAVGGY